MTHVGSRNSPDGRYTIRDDSLPHQIRLTRNARAGNGNLVELGCTCQKRMGLFDTADPGWLDKAWEAYDEHTIEETE